MEKKIIIPDLRYGPSFMIQIQSYTEKIQYLLKTSKLSSICFPFKKKKITFRNVEITKKSRSVTIMAVFCTIIIDNVFFPFIQGLLFNSLSLIYKYTTSFWFR